LLLLLLLLLPPRGVGVHGHAVVVLHQARLLHVHVLLLLTWVIVAIAIPNLLLWLLLWRGLAELHLEVVRRHSYKKREIKDKILLSHLLIKN
jgi:hypothetical protein